MSDDVFRKHKLTDAVPNPGPHDPSATQKGVDGPTHETVVEQLREAQESEQARDAQGELRDRLVGIGKANHMAGRGNGRVRDT